jgi:hypothetical protein
MSIINFDELYIELKTGVESIAKDSWKDYENAARTDGQNALNDMKANLQQWARELETGAITKNDVGFLVQEDAALGKMTALKQAGLAEVHIDKFRNSVVNLIIGSITGLIKV